MDFEAVQIAVGTDSTLELVFFFLMLTYLPFGLYQVYLMFVNILTPDSRYMKGMKPLEKPNNIIVVVTTNGMATDVVEKIIKKIKSYSMGIRVFVIKEYRDTFEYDCDQIVVPKDYKCPNSSRNKMRAMQYGIRSCTVWVTGKKRTSVIWMTTVLLMNHIWNLLRIICPVKAGRDVSVFVHSGGICSHRCVM